MTLRIGQAQMNMQINTNNQGPVQYGSMGSYVNSYSPG